MKKIDNPTDSVNFESGTEFERSQIILDSTIFPYCNYRDFLAGDKGLINP
jgi:hypothetical protein